jgi:hypothetical protein
MRRLRSLLLVIMLGTSASVRAEHRAEDAPQPLTPLSVPAIQDELRSYLRKELRGGVVLMAMGAPGIAIGGGLLAQDRALWRGFAYPLLIIGALEFAGGLLFSARTPRQLRQLEQGFASNPHVTREQELKRMGRIKLQFTMIEALEVSLLVGGVGLAAAGGAARNETLTGVGLGLALESAGLLVFDVFAAARAEHYRHSLERLQISAAPILAPSVSASPISLGTQLIVRGAF